MKPVSLQEISRIVEGELRYADPEAMVGGASVDSREIKPGDLFFAFRGQVDGAKFAADAIERGASAVVCDRPLETPTLVVEDVRGALQSLARWNLRREDVSAPLVVGITGTVGKTTTKDALSTMLRHAGRKTFATAGNFNNEIGLPLTVIASEPKTEVLVLEMGATHSGDIAALCEIAPPEIGILTAISPVHLDSFGSLEALAKAKGELAASLPEDGSLVAPVGVPNEATAAQRELGRRITFGQDSGDLRATGIEEREDGLRFIVHFDGESVEMTSPVYGTHLVRPLLAAIGGALAAGLTLEECSGGVSRLKRTGLRGEMYRLSGDIVVYDDSYNASPAAVEAVLKYGAGQASQQGRRLVAVLGGMFELGPSAREYHREAGAVAEACGVELLVCVGEEARWYGETFARETLYFQDAASAAESLKTVLQPEDYVVVKGSRGVGLDALTQKLKESLARV